MGASATRTWIKALSPRLVAKALSTLDKSTAIVVSACWGAASVTLILAVFAVHAAVSAKKEAETAAISEPILPKASETPITAREVQGVIDRLQHQFPDIKFSVEANQTIMVKSQDGAKFHQWITALSYIDTMAPQFRWSLVELCVGACNNQDLMRAVVSGQKVVFALPQHGT